MEEVAVAGADGTCKYDRIRMDFTEAMPLLDSEVIGKQGQGVMGQVRL